MEKNENTGHGKKWECRTWKMSMADNLIATLLTRFKYARGYSVQKVLAPLL